MVGKDSSLCSVPRFEAYEVRCEVAYAGHGFFLFFGIDD